MTQRPIKPDDTAALLHGLIAECGEMVRTQLRPGMEAEDDPDIKWGYAKAVAGLVRIAAQAGEAVARLRDGGGETRHTIIVHRLPPEEGGHLASVSERSELTEAGAPRTTAERRSEGRG